jgi:hypothetical protein
LAPKRYAFVALVSVPHFEKQLAVIFLFASTARVRIIIAQRWA